VIRLAIIKKECNVVISKAEKIMQLGGIPIIVEYNVTLVIV